MSTNILFLNWQFPFSNTAHATCFTNLFYRLIDFDKNNKNEINFFSLAFNVTEKDLQEFSNGYNYFINKYGDIVKEKYYIRTTKKNSFFNSLYEIIYGNIKVRKYIKHQNIEKVFLYGDNTLILLSLGLKIKFILDLKGDRISEDKASGSSIVKIFLFKLLQKYLFPKMSKIFVSSSKLIDLYKNYNSEKNFSLNTNYYNDDIFKPINTDKNRITKFIYCGGLAKYQLIDESIKLFQSYNKLNPLSEIMFIILGDHELVKEKLKKYNIDITNYTIRSARTGNEINNYLNSADIALMLRADEVFNYYSFPTKFAEYLGAGLPVITTAHVWDVNKIVHDNILGVIIELDKNFDNEVIKIHRFLQNNDGIKQKCSSYASANLSWKANIERIHREILEV